MIVHDCEQGSEEWYALRAGKPTASEFSKLITSTGAASKSMPTYAAALAAELYAGKPLESFEGNVWTQRGKELEEQALARYQFDRDCEVEPVGFVTDDHGRYGCSPDGLTDEGLVEVKCLKIENHVKALVYFNKHKKCPPDYVAQTQGQLFITERPWCDLIFYNPELPMLVIRQYPDGQLIQSLETQLALVLEERDRILNILEAV